MQRIKSVDFAVSNLGGSLGYRLINSSGSITSARTNVGIIEIGSGAYFALITIPNDWNGVLLWDDGKSPRVYAHETIDKNILGIGTLLNRIPGSIKRTIEGTFNYNNIALISNLGTHLQTRIPGSVKRDNTGTFSYGNIALISSLGTHLQSRIPGSVATKGDIGSVKGATFNPVTDSLEQIRDNITIGAGSTPSYIGSMVWSKNPNNFIAADTFGQRVAKILERASSGVGGVAVAAQVFNEKDKKLLFDWINAMMKRVLAIEIIINQSSQETKSVLSKFVVDVKINHTKLQESLQEFLKIDSKKTKNITEDLDMISDSLIKMNELGRQVWTIKNSLATLSESLPLLIKEIPVKDISSTITTQTQEIKNLVSQSINIASDVEEKLKRNLIFLEEQRKSLKITDEILLSLVPREKLKDIIERIDGKN